MARAKCLNESCEKEPWVLRKEISEYKRGPTCPDCGTTRVEIEGADESQGRQAKQPHNQDQGQQQPPGGNAPNPPAPPQQQPQQGQQPVPQGQQGQQGQLPAQAQQQHVEQGLALGTNVLSPLVSNDPSERQKGKGRLLQTLGAAMASAGQQTEQRAEQGRQRAEERAGEEIAPSDQLPVCAECGAQIHDMPEPGATFSCPGCGIILEA